MNYPVDICTSNIMRITLLMPFAFLLLAVVFFRVIFICCYAAPRASSLPRLTTELDVPMPLNPKN
jgi:hypothetical protein